MGRTQPWWPSCPRSMGSREPITKAEILNRLFPGQQQLLPAVFSKACKCKQVVVDTKMQEANPWAQSYDLAITLVLSYEGMLGPEQSVLKTGLLLMVFGLILLQGDCTPQGGCLRSTGDDGHLCLGGALPLW